MPGLRRRQLERRVQGERLAEFLAARGHVVVRALDEREMLERIHLVLRRQAALERGLQALRGGFGFDRLEDRTPDGMARLRGREREFRIGRQRLPELVAAWSGASGRAVDE